MSDVLSHLRDIPTAVWAAVVGPTVALIGVLLTLLAARRQFAAQLAHDSAERTRERQMAWRRQVYLEAAESISRLSGLLGRMADVNLPESEVSRVFQDDYSRISRIQVIAKDKMVAAVNAYLGAFGSIYTRLGIDRGLLVSQRNEIEPLEKQLQRSTESRERCEMLILQSDQKDDKLRAEIAIQMEVHRRQAEHCTQRKLSLMTQLPKTQLALLKASFDAAFQLAPLLTLALLAAREELELPLDVEQFNKQSSRMIETLRSDVTTAMARVDKIMSDETTP